MNDITYKYNNTQLDLMVKSNSVQVRCVVAGQGRKKDLDKLVYDSSPIVRCNVAKNGFGLDLLINDENEHVAKSASEKMIALGYIGLNAPFRWAKDNPDKAKFFVNDEIRPVYDIGHNARGVSESCKGENIPKRGDEER